MVLCQGDIQWDNPNQFSRLEFIKGWNNLWAVMDLKKDQMVQDQIVPILKYASHDLSNMFLFWEKWTYYFQWYLQGKIILHKDQERFFNLFLNSKSLTGFYFHPPTHPPTRFYETICLVSSHSQGAVANTGVLSLLPCGSSVHSIQFKYLFSLKLLNTQGTHLK